MRLIATLWFSIVLAAGWSPTVQAASEKPPVTLNSIFSTDDFQSQLIENLQWAADGKSFTFTRPDPATGLLDIYEHSLKGSSEKLVLATSGLSVAGQNVRMSGYRFSNDGQYLLITGPVVRTWDSILKRRTTSTRSRIGP